MGLFCGHLKSARYADMLGWQAGVAPGSLAGIDFRRKLPGRPANEKGVLPWQVGEDPDRIKPRRIQEFFGGPYNLGFFQYPACDFCDDVVAETADISVGDAWLPKYIDDEHGTSILVVRHPALEDLIQAGIKDKRLRLEQTSKETVIQSQAGGFRQRREGLAYRLHLADEKGIWRPPKRVKPRANHITRRRKKVYELRARLSRESHDAFQRALDRKNLEAFQEAMAPMLRSTRHFLNLCVL